jgi:hypothetical protein
MVCTVKECLLAVAMMRAIFGMGEMVRSDFHIFNRNMGNVSGFFRLSVRRVLVKTVFVNPRIHLGMSSKRENKHSKGNQS